MTAISNTLVDGTTAVIEDTDPVTVIASIDEDQKLYITSILVTNGIDGADTNVIIKIGAKVIATGFAQAGGGFNVPIPHDSPRTGDTDEDLTAECETTGAEVIVSASGYSGL